MEESYLNLLVNKYANGTATENEREELLAWYRKNSENGYILPYLDSSEEDAAKERLLRNLQQQIRGENLRRHQVSRLYFRIAAAATLIVSMSFSLLWLSNYRRKNDDIVYNIISTKAGEHKIVKLADGTSIWLGAESRLRYPPSFSNSTRDVSLEGEAYFDVAKDKHHPFIVHTGVTSTRVLGTTFNITSLKNKPFIAVSLLTGRVAFTVGKAQLNLLPGHQILYNKITRNIEQSDIPDMDEFAKRRDGNYEYKNVRVADVIEDVNLNFNTNIRVEGQVKDCVFFGSIKSGENVRNFLRRLTIVNKAELIEVNGSYIIKGGGCDNDLK